MNVPQSNLRRPNVRLIGNADHPDFVESLSLLRATALFDEQAVTPPELVIVAQSRPGDVTHREVKLIQQRFPLAGVVGLLGSWCEGETRTSNPLPGITRIFWYDFPLWWRRQLALRAAGLCPDSARPFQSDSPSRNPKSIHPALQVFRNCPGVVVLRTQYSSTAQVLSDVLTRAGFATVHQPRGQLHPFVRGASAAIWEGAQLNDWEVADLSDFCRRLSRDATYVIALLDFPRRDRVARAHEAGAAVVLGKPWHNADLIGALQFACGRHGTARAA
jgi:hypothetical protein